MSDAILVSTRKGLFEYRRTAAGRWEVADRAFLGSPVTLALLDPHDGARYAALNLGHFGVKLHRRDAGADAWVEAGAPDYSGVEGDPAPSLELIWALAPDGRGGLWAGTIPGGLFHSADRGATWTLNRGLWDQPPRANWWGGGYDHAGIHSVCVDPSDPDRVAVAVSSGGMWFTEDGGATWRISTKGMFAEYMPPEQREDPNAQDPHQMVRCASAPDHLWIQHHNGIFRSIDGGANWASVAGRPSSFGFAVAVHPRDPLTAWFAPAVKDEFRYPVDGKFVISRTRDGGASFEVLDRGLPQGEAYDLVYRHGMDVDSTGDRLVVGSTTGGLWVSEDGGDSWTAVSLNLPPIYAARFV